MALVAGLLVPGWCLLSLLRLKGLSAVLALPAAAGLGFAIVSVAAWLGWASDTGMIGAAILTAVAAIAAMAAWVVSYRKVRGLRSTSQALPPKGSGHGLGSARWRGDGDLLFTVGAGALALFCAGISLFNGPWLGQSADSFYHMTAALRLLQENRAIPQDVFFGVTMQFPDATSGTMQIALAWLSLISGIVPAWKALAIFGSAFLALAFANFAREVTRSAPAALIAAFLYYVVSLYFDMRDMAYPDRIGQALGWLALVFFVRVARMPRVQVTGPSRFPAWSRGYRWQELVPMCMLGLACGSVYPGMAPDIVLIVIATFVMAALAALRRHDLRSLEPLGIACAGMLIVALPVLAIRLLAALPQPGLDATLSTYTPRLKVFVFHGYAFVDPRFWFGATLVTITTVGTACLFGRARRWLLDGDPGAALLWGGLLIVPAACVTPLLTNSSNGLYALARIAFLLSPILFVPLGWEIVALGEVVATIRVRFASLRAAVPLVAGILLILTTSNVTANRIHIGVIPIYRGHGARAISTTHKLDLTIAWADRLRALDAAGPGIVMADLETAYELAGLTGRFVVSVPRGHTPYQDEARDGALRRGDVSDAFQPAANSADFISVLVRYHVTFVMADQARDGQKTWDWIAAQKQLTTVASGKGWKLYRFDPSLIDSALAIPVNSGTGIFPSRVIAGRAVFVRVTSLGQGGLAHVTANALNSGATYSVQFTMPNQAGATITVPVLLPDTAPVDHYTITISDAFTPPIVAGQVEVGHAYEAEYFAGVYQAYRPGFARNAGWQVLNNAIYLRAQATSALRVGSVATHPLAEAPGNYCLSLFVYDPGDGKTNSLSVGLGGNTTGATWSGTTKGVRELVIPASVGTSSHVLTYWVPRGGHIGTVVDRITLYPTAPDGSCPTGPSQ